MQNSLSIQTVLSQKDNYNLAIPFVTESQQVNPYYKLNVSLIYANTDPTALEIYKVNPRNIGKDKWEDLYSLAKPFLERLATEAGIQFAPNVGDVIKVDENTWKASAFGALKLPDGSTVRTSNDFKIVDLAMEEKRYRLLYEEKALNGITEYKAAKDASEKYAGRWVETGMRNEKGYPVRKYVIEESERNKYIEKSLLDAMTQLRTNAPQKAATGARLRVIKGLLGIKNRYTMDELKKPFAVARMSFSPDYNDPIVKQMMLQMCMQSVGSLFGNVQPVMQTISVQQPLDVEEDIDNITVVSETPQENGYASGYQQQQEGQKIPEERTGEKMQQGSIQHTCIGCGTTINERVLNYSLDKYGKPLCMKCQRSAGK